MVLDAQCRGGVPLRVEVDHQHPQPCIASAAARLTALVVLPTPPFWLAIVMTRQSGGLGHSFSPRFARTRSAAAAACAIGCARFT